MSEVGNPERWEAGQLEVPVRAGCTARVQGTAPLVSDVGPPWLRSLVDNIAVMPGVSQRRLSADVLAMGAAASTMSSVALRRDGCEAAVLVLFSGPKYGPPDGSAPNDADLLLTVRASTLRHHAGQAAFPGGASDPTDDGPVATAFREAHEETGIDLARLHPLATLERTFIVPSRFHVVPVLAYSTDPGPVAVVNKAETAIVARVPVRAFINPANRLTVYRRAYGHRWSGPAFLLNEMLVWGFTGQVIAAMLDVAGWAQPWDVTDVRELGEAMALVDSQGDPR